MGWMMVLTDRVLRFQKKFVLMAYVVMTDALHRVPTKRAPLPRACCVKTGSVWVGHDGVPLQSS